MKHILDDVCIGKLKMDLEISFIASKLRAILVKKKF